jgi:thymidylate synthase (FAD)
MYTSRLGRSQRVKIVREPKVYLVGRQSTDSGEVDRFLADHGATWSTDTEVGAERLCEVAGRVCYMSFGKGRKTNREYLEHIISSYHGSVLEHATWNFIFVGVSRSFTHELIRHRAGWGYSQLSQRYVDESDCDFVEPDVIANDPELHAIWMDCVKQSHAAYIKLVEGLSRRFENEESATLRRKLARQAARSVLPNATETKIFATANARALRHFIEARANEHAETEIRKVAIQVLQIMQKESPTLFGDYQIVTHTDGLPVARTEYRKV